MEIDELERENTLKLKQILDLEEALLDVQILESTHGGPCWCVDDEFTGVHTPSCKRARDLTEHLWKGITK